MVLDPQTSLIPKLRSNILALDLRCVLAIYYVNIMCINRMTNTHNTHIQI